MGSNEQWALKGCNGAHSWVRVCILLRVRNYFSLDQNKKIHSLHFLVSIKYSNWDLIILKPDFKPCLWQSICSNVRWPVEIQFYIMPSKMPPMIAKICYYCTCSVLKTQSLTHWVTNFLFHSLTHSVTHFLSHSLTHSLTQ